MGQAPLAPGPRPWLDPLVLAGLVWVALMASDPLRVQVVALSNNGAAPRAAEDLAQALGLDARLRLHPPLAAALPHGVETSLRQVSEMVAAARRRYQELDPQAALTLCTQAEVELRPLLHRDEARLLLAQSLRTKGLILLFLERAEPATAAFASSSFLDPDFVPPAEEWPPRARLLYGDALAKLRQAAPGALSVQVTPAAARVYVDGREVGLGSTTLREIKPGNHFLLVTCPGHASFAGAVEIAGDGKLSDAPVFLQADQPAALRAGATAALAAAWETADEEVVVRQLAALLAADLVVVVTPDPLVDASTAPALAWLLGADGRRRGGAVRLSTGAASELLAPVWGAPGAAPLVWYRRWYVWAAAGAVAAAAGGVVIWQALDDRPQYRDIIIGRNP